MEGEVPCTTDNLDDHEVHCWCSPAALKANTWPLETIAQCVVMWQAIPNPIEAVATPYPQNEREIIHFNVVAKTSK